MDKKTVILGTFPETRKIGRYHSALHVKVEIEIRSTDKGPELSIMGDTYYPGARDVESCGQILPEVRRLLDADLRGTDLNRPREKIARLLDIWERWHLNGMRPGCEHQRASWNPLEKIQLVTYKQRSEVLMRVHATARAAVERLVTVGVATYTPEETRLANLPWKITRDASQPAPGPEYEVEKREEKTAGWVKPEESPAGLLAKPCPTCGYKYGSAWLYEPLPAEVVKFLEDF